jgi:predicted outer membrane repeat protein
VDANYAADVGGGLFLDGGGSLKGLPASQSTVTFDGNSAVNGGGGMAVRRPDFAVGNGSEVAAVENVVFQNCTTQGNGGGMFVVNGSASGTEVVVRTCTAGSDIEVTGFGDGSGTSPASATPAAALRTTGGGGAFVGKNAVLHLVRSRLEANVAESPYVVETGGTGGGSFISHIGGGNLRATNGGKVTHDVLRMSNGRALNGGNAFLEWGASLTGNKDQAQVYGGIAALEGGNLYVGHASDASALKLSGGTALRGAGVFAFGSGVKLSRSEVTDNGATCMAPQTKTSTLDDKCYGAGIMAGRAFAHNTETVQAVSTVISDDAAKAHERTNMEITEVTVANNGGSRVYGGGISIYYGHVTHDRLHVVNNTAQSAGGVDVCDERATKSLATTFDRCHGELTGVASTVDRNTLLSPDDSTDGVGANVRLGEFSSMALSGLGISNGAAHRGAGMFLSANTNTSVSLTRFEDNLATNGGAVYVSSSSVLRMSGCWAKRNNANGTSGDASGGNGGAVFLVDTATGLFSTNDFDDNVCSARGGAIYQQTKAVNDPGGLVTSTADEFNRNTAGVYGGAIYAGLHTTLQTHSGTAFTANTATTSGGSIYLSELSTSSLVGTIIDGGWRANQADTSARYPGNGGLVFCEKCTISNLDQCVLKGGKAANGGALYANNGKLLSVEGTDVSDNYATANGGGIYLQAQAMMKMRNSTVSDNEATFDGAGVAVNQKSEVDVEASTLSANEAGDRGGAIFLDTTQNKLTTSDGTSFLNNRAAGNGAGVYVSRSSAYTCRHSAFSGNGGTAQRPDWGTPAGGAIYVADTDVTVEDSNFTNNKAAEGGALYVMSRSNSGYMAKVDRCTLDGNQAQTYGGGIALRTFARADVTNSTLSNNKAPNGGGMDLDSNTIVNFKSSNGIENAATLTHVTGGTAASTSGGGLLCRATSTCTITHGSSFTRNAADFHGGAVAALGSSNVTMNATTLTGNTAMKFGGAFYSDHSNTTVTTVTTVTTPYDPKRRLDTATTVTTVTTPMVITLSHLAFNDNSAKSGTAISVPFGPNPAGLHREPVECSTCTFADNVAAAQSPAVSPIGTNAASLKAGWSPATETAKSLMELQSGVAVVRDSGTDNGQPVVLPPASGNPRSKLVGDWMNPGLEGYDLYVRSILDLGLANHSNIAAIYGQSHLVAESEVSISRQVAEYSHPYVLILDAKGNVATLDSSTTCDVTADATDLTLSPSTATAKDGVVTLVNMKLEGAASNVPYIVKITCNTPTIPSASRTVTMALTLGPCIPGSALVNNVCTDCADGKYSIHGRECLDCPEGAECSETITQFVTSLDGTTASVEKKIGVAKPTTKAGYYFTDISAKIKPLCETTFPCKGSPFKWDTSYIDREEAIYKCYKDPQFAAKWTTRATLSTSASAFECLTGQQIYPCKGSGEHLKCAPVEFKDQYSGEDRPMKITVAGSSRAIIEYNNSCDIGYTGVVCGQCAIQYAIESSGQCNPCPAMDPDGTNPMLTAAYVGFPLAILFLIFVLTKVMGSPQNKQIRKTMDAMINGKETKPDTDKKVARRFIRLRKPKTDAAQTEADRLADAVTEHRSSTDALDVGQRVQAQWKGAAAEKKKKDTRWWPAKIGKVNKDGTYEVQFNGKPSKKTGKMAKSIAQQVYDVKRKGRLATSFGVSRGSSSLKVWLNPEKLKILTGFLQIFSSFKGSYSISFPPTVTKVMSSANVFNFEVLSMAKSDCFARTNFYNKFLFYLISCPTVVLFLFVCYKVGVRSYKKMLHTMPRRCVRTGLPVHEKDDEEVTERRHNWVTDIITRRERNAAVRQSAKYLCELGEDGVPRDELEHGYDRSAYYRYTTAHVTVKVPPGQMHLLFAEFEYQGEKGSVISVQLAAILGSAFNHDNGSQTPPVHEDLRIGAPLLEVDGTSVHGKSLVTVMHILTGAEHRERTLVFESQVLKSEGAATDEAEQVFLYQENKKKLVQARVVRGGIPAIGR